MPAANVDELRSALRRPHGCEMPDRPDGKTGEPQAQAEANRVLAQSLTPDLIRYQQLQRWDGKLPVFTGGGATPLIDATSIISGTPGR